MELLALKGGVSTQRRAVICLIANISSQVIAIRRLISAGLDVQAKQLVRMLTEQIDVAILISLDEKSAEKFVLTIDENTANQFWHKNVAKQKFRNMLFPSIKNVLGDSDADEMIFYIQDEEKLLGATVHPSIMASHAALVPMTEKEEEHPFGFLGRVTVFSERTLMYSTIYMFLLLVFGNRLVCNVEEWPASTEKEFATTLRASIGLGRDALPRIIAGAFGNADHRELSSDHNAVIRSYFSDDM